MRMIRTAALTVVALLFFACAQKDTGNFKISLKLPENTINSCTSLRSDDLDDFCIVRNDSIELTIFSTDDLAKSYTLDETKIFRVSTQVAGDTEFSRSLRTNRYYRFFVKITNDREKVKLTGGVEGVYYEESKNYDVNIFLGLAGDFVRLVSLQSEKSSLETYIPEDGSSGARAAVLKDGRVFIAGGSLYSGDEEMFSNKANYVDMADLKVVNAPSLREAVKDHVMDRLDALGSKYGKIVIAFGKTQDGYSDKVYLLDPEKEAVETKTSFSGRAHARSLVIDGEVYISGGCDDGSASKDIIKVSKTGSVDKWRDMGQGRCLHGMVDVSYTTQNEQGDTIVHPAILVFGGATKNIVDSTNRNLIGLNSSDVFAEIIDENGSKTLAVLDASGDALTGVTLAGHAAARIKWDDPNKGPAGDLVAVAAGGFIQSALDTDLTLSLNNYVMRGAGALDNPKDMSWTLYAYGTSVNCSYATMVPVSSPESFSVQFAALNCGSNKGVQRSGSNRSEQQIYTIEVRASGETPNFELVASARSNITGSAVDDRNPGIFSDGPVALNDFGQAFLFGTQYVYLVSGFSYGIY